MPMQKSLWYSFAINNDNLKLSNFHFDKWIQLTVISNGGFAIICNEMSWV